MTEIKILPMTAADGDGVADLHAECFTGERWSRSMIEAELDEKLSPFAVTYVARDNARVVGFVNARLICGECGINDIAVTSAMRKNGIGAMLLSEMTRRAHEAGHQHVALIVDEYNPSAEKLYTRMGFRRAGTRMFFGHRMWHMQHTL